MKLTTKERAAFRDQIALQVALICMADLSRLVSNSGMPLTDVPRATSQIAAISYLMADALLEARGK